MALIKALPQIPAERALRVIGGRWKVFVLYYLFQKPLRLSELRRLIPTVSQKVLVQSLRELEEHGVVTREIFPEIPPRVVYTATKLGMSLQPIVKSLCDWGKRHADELDVAAERAEAPPKLTRGTKPKRVPKAPASSK
jgi:DNA-binding HxlR family transcriptional regulator